ncbi:hypothetical protein [Nocardia paucivorans]|uniref:hypothetical protein n=1 Tax=Nocardia paucivorans TaxID=114259 RepID=UPI00031E7470|nr:hypothetical protein [Nocardia paucivorans]
MSTGQPVGMEPDALGKMANDFRSSASVVKAQGEKVSTNMVGPGDVGHAYSEKGKRIQSGLEAVQAWLNNWSEATDLTGDAIGQSVVEFSNVDRENANQNQKAAS